MTAIDRRKILIGLVCGVAIAIAAALVPHAANSAPLGISKSDFVRPNALVREARTVTVGPHRHHPPSPSSLALLVAPWTPCMRLAALVMV